ncbi:glycosyltransferase family 2 protein [Plantibacter sp. YIM 135249]|uniref:glycosyltransferase family 2 protein n=1 Tax=Plantibacter sp. YIM 135249 TaxID=3423918 RepID=UPI003D3365D7
MSGHVIPSPAETTVSVVIPVGSSVDRLSEQLDALTNQSYEGPRDLIVSCNGVSVHDVEPLLASVRAHGWTARTVDSSSVRGPSHARNVGWRAAHSELILFCDDDDLVEMHWMAAMVEALASDDIVGGALELSRLNTAAAAAVFGSGPEGLPTKFSYLPFSPSCNLALRRSVLVALDGFDEDLLCGEDIDLCWRAAQSGNVLRFAPQAIVHYRLRASVRAVYEQARDYGRDDIHLLQKHRAAGAVWTTRDSAREVLSAARALLVSPLSSAARLRAAARSGAVIGRLQGRRRMAPVD